MFYSSMSSFLRFSVESVLKKNGLLISFPPQKIGEMTLKSEVSQKFIPPTTSECLSEPRRVSKTTAKPMIHGYFRWDRGRRASVFKRTKRGRSWRDVFLGRKRQREERKKAIGDFSAGFCTKDRSLWSWNYMQKEFRTPWAGLKSQPKTMGCSNMRLRNNPISVCSIRTANNEEFGHLLVKQAF